ncbi:MarR family winged helix-turn-helix transcriptional regulator [Bdellovibrio sp. GT3]|uniref:MarR family winged helix-turn-helix transcriptional regulator n=1 Tax=Bdellovibrio sp. GT3 TaxID=3136282 RepID=UPI0030F440F0
MTEDMQLHILLSKLTIDFETALEEFFQEYKLTTTRFIILNLLYNSPDGMTPTETAKAVGVTNATISAIISNLKQVGWIDSRQKLGDSRSYSIVLSDSGLELMNKVLPVYNQNISQMWSQFSSDEKRNLGNLMTRVSQLVGVMSKNN